MKEVIAKEMIFLHRNFTSQEEVFRFLARQLAAAGRGGQEEALVEGVYAREKEFSTALNDRLAIPHCKSRAVKEATVLVVCNEREISWTDGEPVDLLFALMIPAEDENRLHIRILAQVAQLMMEESFIEAVRQGQDAQEIYNAMKDLNAL